MKPSRSWSSVRRSLTLTLTLDWDWSKVPSGAMTIAPVTLLVLPTASDGNWRRASCSRTRKVALERSGMTAKRTGAWMVAGWADAGAAVGSTAGIGEGTAVGMAAGGAVGTAVAPSGSAGAIGRLGTAVGTPSGVAVSGDVPPQAVRARSDRAYAAARPKAEGVMPSENGAARAPEWP